VTPFCIGEEEFLVARACFGGEKGWGGEVWEGWREPQLLKPFQKGDQELEKRLDQKELT
jgi:hypothetical protein